MAKVRTITLTTCTALPIKPKPVGQGPAPKTLNVSSGAVPGGGTLTVANDGNSATTDASPGGSFDDSFEVDTSRTTTLHFAGAPLQTVEITYEYE